MVTLSNFTTGDSNVAVTLFLIFPLEKRHICVNFFEGTGVG